MPIIREITLNDSKILLTHEGDENQSTYSVTVTNNQGETLDSEQFPSLAESIVCYWGWVLQLEQS